MSHRAPVAPTPDLIARIKQEVAAPGFLRDLLMWAERVVAKLLSFENRIEPNKASALVNDAIVDTLDGVRRWDPEARTLRRHLEQTVNSRLWHECDRGRRRRHVTLDTTSVDDSQDGCAIDVEMSLRREDPRTRPDGLMAQREVRGKVSQALRARVSDDAQLLALLDCFEAGVHREGEVMARLGLSLSAFRSVARRYKTALSYVPASLFADMREMMIRDGGPELAPVAKRRGRVVEIVPDEPANDSDDSHSAIDASTDDECDDANSADECAA